VTPLKPLSGSHRKAIGFCRGIHSNGTATGFIARGDSMPEDVVGQEKLFAVPETPTEERLAAIWKDLLGIDRVGRNDTFMNVGGESILATQVVNRVHATFGVDIPVDVLFFDEATLAELANTIDAQRSGNRSAVL
jgi:hypothetical protein